ncbi:MAG TPA: TonB-dependent receptor, partial [Woeseiaceae bacterium]|nr:TonB-dependent receptor [Woeseiaceae bacterium]
IEGGMSGTVDLRTRMPFDNDERMIAFSAEESMGDLAEEEKPAGSVLFSDRWETGIGELGFLASASTSELASRTDTYHIDKYYERTDLVPDQTVYVPGGIGWRQLLVDRERTGASAALQWRPSDTVELSLQYFYSDATFEQDENAAWNTPGAALSGGNLSFSDSGHLISGDINDGGFAGSARYNKRDSRNHDTALHATWLASDHWTFDFDVQRALADTQVIDLTMGPNVGPLFETTAPYSLTLDGSDEPEIAIPQNELLANPDAYFHGWAMDHHEDNDADAWAYRADAEYTFDNSDWLDRIRFGVRREDYDSTTRETGFRWGSISQNWAGGPAVFSADGMPQIYGRQNFSDWFHGDDVPSPFLYQDTGIFRSYDRFANTVTGIMSMPGVTVGCCDWTRWDGDFSAKDPAADGLGVNPQNQKTWAAYGVVDFGHERWDGNVGVRVVRTEGTGQGLLKFEPLNTTFVPDDDQAFANGAAVVTTDDNDYTDVLPSLNVRYEATDDLFVRFAAGRSLSRPDFPLLLPSITIAPEEGRLVNGTCTEKGSGDSSPGDCIFRYTGTSGNPDLEPMRSWQFDLSAEWYMNPTNSLTGAIFYKRLEGFMETTLDVVVPYTNNGVTREVAVLRPENQGSGNVQGLEVAYNGFFDFLPGFWSNFGSRASFTYVDSSGTRNVARNPFDANQQTNSRFDDFPLEGLSKTSYNVELYYATDRFEARAAYNWRERYLLTMAAANLNVPAFADDYGQLDASVKWYATDNITIGLQAVNLTDATYRILVDNLNGAGMTYHNWVDSDRRYSLFVRASF